MTEIINEPSIEIAELVDKQLDELNKQVEQLSDDIDDLNDIKTDAESRLEQKKKEHEELITKMYAIEREAEHLGIL